MQGNTGGTSEEDEGSKPNFVFPIKQRTTLGPTTTVVEFWWRGANARIVTVYTSSGTSVDLLHELEWMVGHFTLVLVAGSKGPPELVSRVHKGGSETKTQ